MNDAGYCARCGTEIPPRGQFCIKCGTPSQWTPQTPPPVVQQPASPQSSFNGKTGTALLLICIAVIAASVGFNMYQAANPKIQVQTQTYTPPPMIVTSVSTVSTISSVTVASASTPNPVYASNQNVPGIQSCNPYGNCTYRDQYGNCYPCVNGANCSSNPYAGTPYYSGGNYYYGGSGGCCYPGTYPSYSNPYYPNNHPWYPPGPRPTQYPNYNNGNGNNYHHYNGSGTYHNNGGNYHHNSNGCTQNCHP